MRRLLPLLCIILLLFSSCHHGRKAYYLEGEKESVAYLVEGNTAVMVHVPSWVTSSYGSYAGVEGKKNLESLFGIKATSYGQISQRDFDKRMELLELLRKETGSEDAMHAYSAFRKDLRKTGFIDTMNALSSSFEDRKLSKEIKSGTHVYEYDLNRILSETAPWDRQKAYLDRWVAAILRNV